MADLPSLSPTNRSIWIFRRTERLMLKYDAKTMTNTWNPAKIPAPRLGKPRRDSTMPREILVMEKEFYY